MLFRGFKFGGSVSQVYHPAMDGLASKVHGQGLEPSPGKLLHETLESAFRAPRGVFKQCKKAIETTYPVRKIVLFCEKSWVFCGQTQFHLRIRFYESSERSLPRSFPGSDPVLFGPPVQSVHSLA